MVGEMTLQHLQKQRELSEWYAEMEEIFCLQPQFFLFIYYRITYYMHIVSNRT